MAVFDVTLPDGPQSQQILQVLTQLLQKVGGSIKPDDCGPGQGAPAQGARANRPANLLSPQPTAGPAPQAPAAPPPM